MKTYKACSPSQTINNIREKLFNLGLTLKENHYNSDLFYACKISVCNKDLEKLSISSNGKGMSSLYSLASAYGEFMERIQNNMLFDNMEYGTAQYLNSKKCDPVFRDMVIEQNLELDFQFDPKEVEIDVFENINSNYLFYKNLFPFISDKEGMMDFISNDLNFKTVKCIPFHAVGNDEERYLPIELILSACGSTGMCGGNTKEEALIQGFCEIFERYVGKRIYFENITPPDIPFDYFKDTNIYDKLIELNKDERYTLKIKDCSIGLGLPVIGFLIIDTKERKYNFHLGSSLSPIIALERCLTEIHQNPLGIYWLDINLSNFSNEKLSEDEYLFYNGNKIFAYGIGLWPNSIFGKNPNYEFNGLNNALNHSDKEDIEFIKNKVSELGFNIFIRDVSFLDFPSYYIVIPGMNEFPTNREQYNYLGNLGSKIKNIRNLKNLSEADLEDTCNELNKYYEIIKFIDFRYQSVLLYNTNPDIDDLDLELFMFMLNYRLKKYNEAFKYISTYLKDKEFSTHKYYFGIKDYLSLILQDKTKPEIESILKTIYNGETAEIISDMENPLDVFNYYEWPTCFNCKNCEILDDCKYLAFLKIHKKIQFKQINSSIDHKLAII